MSQNPQLAASFSGNTVFRKTRRGYAEIAQETQLLSNSLRRFLGFVDGSRNLDKLVEITQVLGDTRVALAQLINDGFITAEETTGAYQVVPPRAGNVAAFPNTVQPPQQPMQQPQYQQPQYQPPQYQQPAPQQYQPAPQQAPMPQQTSAPQSSMAAPSYVLEQVKNYMLADLRARMGKDAELIAPKILAARSNEDLIVMMMRLRDILSKYSGNDGAEQFVKKFKDMLI